MKSGNKFFLALTIAVAHCGLGSTWARAQSSSLFGPPDRRPPLTLSGTSWSFIELEPPRDIKLNDIVTVIVDETAQVISEGEINRRLQSNVNATLGKWLQMSNLDITPAELANGPLAVDGRLNSQFQAQSELEAREGMKLRIAAHVVDVRPNGNLILEGRRTFVHNDEHWEISVSGVVRPIDVLPNNTILSEDVAELHVYKRESGQVRDGYRRGWLLRLIDENRPF